MKVNRREFLKNSFLATCALGVSGLSFFELLKPGELETSMASKPTRKRWAMTIDVNKFETDADYQKCIDVCHQAHNVPKIDNPKHEVKWIWTDTFEHVFPGQADEFLAEKLKDIPFPVLCNHCKNPPCVRVCPTGATFKRENGIVDMDFHICIGCRMCMSGCPYASRSFNFMDPRNFFQSLNRKFPTRTKGVVEKCNFCNERVVKGLQPACVEVSKGAMVFGNINDPESEVRKILRENYAIRRKPELGTEPSVYYIIGSSSYPDAVTAATKARPSHKASEDKGGER